MEIKFDGHQQYQIDAVEAVCDLFYSQPFLTSSPNSSFSMSDGDLFSELGVSNNLQITQDRILNNLREIQDRQGLNQSESLDGMNFSVEMETGTGKTYVYLRTIYELAKRYGFKKYIIVVPSVAIREGVKKTIAMTKEHFDDLYDRTPCESWVYDSSKLSNIRQFAASNQIQILIINIDAFNKDSNIINVEQEMLAGKKPIDFLRACYPIVIIDEPQNIESELARKAIDSLSPLCTLRYSATHRHLYNVVYRLTPVQAYDLRLVKHIEVDSIVDEGDNNAPFISVQEIKAQKNKITAKLLIDVSTPNGTKRKTITIGKNGLDLFELSGGRDAYRGYVIQEIDASNGYISFSNGVELSAGESQGINKDGIMRAQIKEAVREHFEKELLIYNSFPQGSRIKVLSLFFIDRVANYVPIDGKIRLWFIDAYNECAKLKRFSQLKMLPVERVHGGYFSETKGKARDTTGTTKADDDAYQLIMRDKERLLSIEEPLKFIFSHSALREGWDNPNIFQICTLNDTSSEIKKRQEIGRGLRLPVDEQGIRCFDERINRLTIIANESYESFAQQLQTEIEEDTGVSFKGKIENKHQRRPIHLKQDWKKNPEFLALWDKIKQRTQFVVNYDTEQLVSRAADRISTSVRVSESKLIVRKARLNIDDEGITGQLQSAKEVAKDNESEVFPDLIGYLQKETELTRKTISRILIQSGRLKDALINPQEFLDKVLVVLKDVIQEFLVSGIQYIKRDGIFYDLQLFTDEGLDGYLSKMIAVNKSIFDYVEYDSDVEKVFASVLDSRSDIKLFLKLPSWYLIETPVGSYNPDWAIIKQSEEDGPKLVLVRETKGTTDERHLRKSEVAKIHCGKEHFSLLDVDYSVVVSANDV